jgi:metal-responsive CopG/Arc/MetJ family transcriptional regulator
MSLINAVEDIAKRESVARSDVVAWALVEFVERYRASQVDWAKHKRPTKSLRVDWKLELPGDWR